MCCCSTVCGLWSSQLGKRSSLTLFLPHIPCPQHVSGSRVGPPHSIITARPLCLFIHQLCLRRCGCVASWGPSPFPHSSLLPKHPLPVCWRGLGLFWTLALGSVCVCLTFSPPNPIAMCYQWDLHLSVSDSAARRRRKQDARGSTVISQRALFHTIPGRSLCSLHAGLPLDIYMCQQSQLYWPN